MKWKLLSSIDEQRTFAVVFDAGDEALEGLQEFAAGERLSGASFTAIGAFERVVLGYFDVARREYKRIPLDEQLEVLTLAGNIAIADGAPKVHAHVVVGRSDGTAYGGHLLDGRVRPTLEVVVESSTHLKRTVDEATGLALLNIGRSEKRRAAFTLLRRRKRMTPPQTSKPGKVSVCRNQLATVLYRQGSEVRIRNEWPLDVAAKVNEQIPVPAARCDQRRPRPIH
jgi:predicted DNA-binding protein with PD1-like motif